MCGFLAVLCFAVPIVLWTFDESIESSYSHGHVYRTTFRVPQRSYDVKGKVGVRKCGVS